MFFFFFFDVSRKLIRNSYDCLLTGMFLSYQGSPIPFMRGDGPRGSIYPHSWVGGTVLGLSDVRRALADQRV